MTNTQHTIYHFTDQLREGLIVHVRTDKWFSRMIRKVLSRHLRLAGLPPVWGSHDAITMHNRRHEMVIGEAVSPRVVESPLLKYERLMYEGAAQVRVYEVIGACRDCERAAGGYFSANLVGRFYDWGAFPRLLAKGIIGDIFPTAVVGWEWAHWCTEAVADAYRKGTHIDPYQKPSPTPLTTEKRAGMYGCTPTLRDVTAQMIAPSPPWIERNLP